MRMIIRRADLWANPKGCYCLGTRLTLHALGPTSRKPAGSWRCRTPKDPPDRGPRLAGTLPPLCFLSQPRWHCGGARTSHSRTTPESPPSPWCDRTLDCSRWLGGFSSQALLLLLLRYPRSTAVRPSVSPQLSQRREVDSLSSSATDWCVEMSRSARSTGYNTLLSSYFQMFVIKNLAQRVSFSNIINKTFYLLTLWV